MQKVKKAEPTAVNRMLQLSQEVSYMFGFGKKKNGVLCAVQNGEIIPVEKLPDPVFSQKVLGEGTALLPENGLILSPCTGVVSNVADTLHAYGITTDDGLEILVHIGIDTVQLNGQGFESLIQEGARVKAGDPLAKADLECIRNHGFGTHVVTVITNSEDVQILSTASGKAKGGETVVLAYRKD